MTLKKLSAQDMTSSPTVDHLASFSDLNPEKNNFISWRTQTQFKVSQVCQILLNSCQVNANFQKTELSQKSLLEIFL